MVAKSTVRPMDPEYISQFLSSKKVSRKVINAFVAALKRYNKANIKAVAKLEEDLNKLKEL
jgi:hypothetical protein